MATHPLDPEPMSPDTTEPAQPNPSHLPVEPEFGPQMPPSEPEAPPGAKPSLP